MQPLIPQEAHFGSPRRRSRYVASAFRVFITATAAVICLFVYIPVLKSFIPSGTIFASTPCRAHDVVDGDANLGAVASESSICSAAGIDMLKKGGNAADAVSSSVTKRAMKFSHLLLTRWSQLLSVWESSVGNLKT